VQLVSISLPFALEPTALAVCKSRRQPALDKLARLVVFFRVLQAPRRP